ncbi:MAG: hypothetical protein ABIP33_04305 [Pseudolysinimonas sp.]
MPRSLARALAVASALAVAAISLSGCTTAPSQPTSSNCAGIIAKVLLTDDSATTVATFSAGDVSKTFGIAGTPAPTCYYSSVATLAPQGGVVYTDTHRTMLYIGLSDADAQTVISAIRKTVSVKPWTVRFDYGAPAPTPSASPSASPTAAASTSTSARWYYNFSGGPSDDKGEMGYYLSAPVSQGTAIQAGLSKPVNVLRVETELRQVKK